ncbi:response regulator transcription factor [Candidatus Parcubacteria bacterium]|nr:response regulator transcription factor [Candidatus Parcubacteria bacterium]
MPLQTLVVDDEEQIRNIIKGALKKRFKEDIEIITLSNGDDAVKDMTDKELPYDLVITDINMPKDMFDGFDVIFQAKELAKKLEKDVIVFAMSGLSENYDKAFELGADIYLEKPFLPSELISLIKAFFRDKKYLPPDLT